MDEEGLHVVTLRWWCDCWDRPAAAPAVLCVDGRAVCDARALLALCDATFDLPPTLGMPLCYVTADETIICECKGLDRQPPWNMHPEGVLVFLRDFDESLVIRADRIEQWLDRWTPAWKLSRMSAIDAANEASPDEGV